MAKQHKIKRADFSDETKPRHSKYALKKKQGCEMNHARHAIPVPWCIFCNP